MVRSKNRVRLGIAVALAAAVRHRRGALDDWRARASPAGPRRPATRPTASAWATGRPPTGAPTPTTRPSTSCCPRTRGSIPRSSAIVARLTEEGGPSDLRAGVADSDGDVQHPTYWSTPGRSRSSRSTAPAPMAAARWRACACASPTARGPPGGSDHHLAVVDQRSGWEYDLWEVESKPSGGGQLVTGYGGRTRIDGDGLGSDATAAHFGLLAGIIRAEELRRGRIDHALFLVADCDSGEFVYPARGRGAPCERPDRRAGGGHALPARHVRRRDPRARSAALEAGHPARAGPLRDVRRRHRAAPRGTSSSSPDRPTRASAIPTGSSRTPSESASRARPTAATTSTWTRGSTGEPPAGRRPVRERAELLTRGGLSPAGRDSRAIECRAAARRPPPASAAAGEVFSLRNSGRLPG